MIPTRTTDQGGHCPHRVWPAGYDSAWRLLPRCLAALAVFAPLAVLLSGCGTLSLQERGRKGEANREDQALDLSGLDTPTDMPEELDKRSAFDVVTAAAYLGTVKPGEAAKAYVTLAKRHGASYESAFARDAFHSAIASAWTAGDPALIRRIFSDYDRRLDVIERAPEPRWIGELRGFFRVRDNERLARAYDQLSVNRQQLSDPLLRRRADRWLERHRSATLALVRMFRDEDPEDWDAELLEGLVEAEANLRGGYVSDDSEILLYAQARDLVNGSREAGTATHIVAVVKLFLTTTDLVHQPDRDEFMLGETYTRKE